MSPTANTVIGVVGGVILTAAFLCVFILSLSGKDLVIFDAYKTTAPKYYRSLKQVCRFNGLLMILLSTAGIIASPYVSFAPDGGILLAVATLIVSAMFLWLSVRWFLWSLRD